MSKAKLSAASSAVQFVSLSDIGYKSAEASDRVESLAALALDNIPEFASCDKHTDVSKETRTEFYVGARLRWNENNPPVEYAVIGDNYIRCDALEKDAKITERVLIGAEVVFALSQQEFGGLKEKQPALHAIHKTVRDACNTYCSNAFTNLFSKAKKLQAKRLGKSTTREQAMLFGKWLEKELDSMKTRAISAESRGDVTVFKKELDAAIVAFKTKYPYFN
jgi:hypothetical protein